MTDNQLNCPLSTAVNADLLSILFTWLVDFDPDFLMKVKETVITATTNSAINLVFMVNCSLIVIYSL